ncbi:MAG: nucleotidyltransferase domain-containing protein [Candidatus Rokuibacteriota bacterium]
MDSARVTFLDVAATVERVRAAAGRVCASDPNVVAVVLFGSLASGQATPSSDADLLVVLRQDDRRLIDRIPDYGRAFEELGLATQVLPWTEQELADRVAEGDPFATEILRTGKVMAGKKPGGGRGDTGER